MKSKKHYLPDSTFYITHSCNLTCNHCQTFNNKRFKGHYLWHKYEDEYKEWSKIVDPGLVNIHGGEPLTNPDILNWANGLKKLWPNAKEYTVSTNGTLLSKKKDLVIELVNKGWRWDVSIHDPITFDSILKSFLEIFQDFNISVIDRKDGEKSVMDIKNNKTIATFLPQYYFFKNAFRYTKKGVVHMWRNDINEAHRLCQYGFAELTNEHNSTPCRWFVAGKLFKCQLTAITEDLIKQFTIEEEAVELLKKYKPASPYQSKEKIDNFIKNLDKPLDQCTLCPVSQILFPIYPLSTKKDA